MWIRDATASVHHLLVIDELWADDPSTDVANPDMLSETHVVKVRPVMLGLARRLAHYILKDRTCSAWEPYDNGRECRGGGSYHDMRFELDSIPYFLRFLRFLIANRGQTQLVNP